MDLQFLLNRKIELQQALNNLGNSWHIITGHIQECDHLITMLSKPELEQEDKSEEPVENPDSLPVE